MFSPQNTASNQPRCDSLQWVQLPNRDDAQNLASGSHDCRSAHHFHRPVPGEFEDVGKDCPRSAADGLAVTGAERLSPLAAAKKQRTKKPATHVTGAS